MTNWLRASSILLIACSSLGCSLCANPFDDDYVTYGSRTPRQDMRYGRVGSPFSDPTHAGMPLESVEAIDDSYGQILEGGDGGPIFMDGPISEPALMDEAF